MRQGLLLSCACLLVLSACGGSSDDTSDDAGLGDTSSVEVEAETVTISGQITVNGSTSTPVVIVDGVNATVTASSTSAVFDWTVTLAALDLYGDYRVEYFVDGESIGSSGYSIDP